MMQPTDQGVTWVPSVGRSDAVTAFATLLSCCVLCGAPVGASDSGCAVVGGEFQHEGEAVMCRLALWVHASCGQDGGRTREFTVPSPAMPVFARVCRGLRQHEVLLVGRQKTGAIGHVVLPVAGLSGYLEEVAMRLGEPGRGAQ